MAKRLPSVDKLKKMGPIELQEVIDEAISRGATVYAGEAIKIKNKLVGYKGAELKKKNKKDYEKAYKTSQRGAKKRKKEREIEKDRKMKLRKLEKLWKWTGINPDRTQAVIDGIPNIRVVSNTFEDYWEIRRLLNDLPGNPNRIPIRQLKKQVKEEYDYAQKLMEEERIRTQEELQKHAINEVSKFLYRYFQNIPRRDEIIYQVQQYFKLMRPKDIFGIREMMQGNKFKRWWDSEQHTLAENTHEVMTNRVNDLFRVLRNETGVNYIFGDNPINYKIEVLKQKKAQPQWTIEHFTSD